MASSTSTSDAATYRRRGCGPLATGYSDFVPSATTRPRQGCLAAVENYAEQTAKAHFVTYRNNLNKLATFIAQTTTGASVSSARGPR